MKQDINKYSVGIYLKMTHSCSSLENENTLAIEMRKHFTEAATEKYLAAIIKII